MSSGQNQYVAMLKPVLIVMLAFVATTAICLVGAFLGGVIGGVAGLVFGIGATFFLLASHAGR